MESFVGKKQEATDMGEGQEREGKRDARGRESKLGAKQVAYDRCCPD